MAPKRSAKPARSVTGGWRWIVLIANQEPKAAKSGFVHAFWISAIGGIVGALMAALVLPRRNRPTRARVTTELAAE